jgi:hypothetical protein
VETLVALISRGSDYAINTFAWPKWFKVKAVRTVQDALRLSSKLAMLLVKLVGCWHRILTLQRLRNMHKKRPDILGAFFIFCGNPVRPAIKRSAITD